MHQKSSSKLRFSSTRNQRKRESAKIACIVIALPLLSVMLLVMMVKAWVGHPAEQLVNGQDYLESIQASPVSYEPTEQPNICKATYASEEPEVAEAAILYPVPLDEDLQLYIVRLCEEHHIEPSVVFAMIDRESDFRANIIGDNGNSFGLMQIQPKWHQARMDKLGCTDLLDPYQNVTVGIDYLAELIDRGNGLDWALAAYNAGPGGANSGRGWDYASGVLAQSENLKGGI